MKTINELGIYFMCCWLFATLFITYLAVKLRAYRIKNASLTNRIEIADKDIADAYDEVDKVKLSLSHHRTESAAIINQSAENNAKLVLEIEHLKDKIECILQSSSATLIELEVAKSDRQKLFDIAKGATDKLAEMNVALEGLEVKEEKKIDVRTWGQGNAIWVNNDYERDKILLMMKDLGLKTIGDKVPFAGIWNADYPFPISVNFDFQGEGVCYWSHLEGREDIKTHYQASQFINL